MFLLPIDEEEDLVEKNANKDKQEKTQDKQEKTNDKKENSIEKSGQKQKENEEKKKDLKAIEKYLDKIEKTKYDQKIQPGKRQGLLKMGPAKQITYVQASEEPDFLERQKPELISIEKSIAKLKAEKDLEEGDDVKENENKVNLLH